MSTKILKSTASKVLLWTGPEHSGKTTTVAKLLHQACIAGKRVGGILAPSVWREGRLIAFDVMNVATGERRRLADHVGPACPIAGGFAFHEEGLAFGRSVLAGTAAAGADLIVVDEFGPLELSGGGWRDAVDQLIGRGSGVILLVVRERLIPKVTRLYHVSREHVIDAGNGQRAITRVLNRLPK